jgi:AcrR family transcriptional regulator
MGKRQESRERIEREIIALGRGHLVTEGAAGLSVRAIARDLGMVSSAVYRYVASRDDLLTLLLIDAYTELADAVDRAHQSTPGSWSDQVLAIARAARQWAVDEPACWALLYGSPVPGYHAPAELTVGPGTRVVGALFGAVAAGIDAGDVEVPNIQAAQPMSADFDVIRAGRLDQPGGVRPVRRGHPDRPRRGVRPPDRVAAHHVHEVSATRAPALPTDNHFIVDLYKSVL